MIDWCAAKGKALASVAEHFALAEFVLRFQIATGREDDSLVKIFGNDRLTYCATSGCDGCDLEYTSSACRTAAGPNPGGWRRRCCCSTWAESLSGAAHSRRC
jgi:hypothetical protein